MRRTRSDMPWSTWTNWVTSSSRMLFLDVNVSSSLRSDFKEGRVAVALGSSRYSKMLFCGCERATAARGWEYVGLMGRSSFFLTLK